MSERKQKLSQLDGLSNEQLLDQIRVFRLVDSIDVRLSGYANKLAVRSRVSKPRSLALHACLSLCFRR